MSRCFYLLPVCLLLGLGPTSEARAGEERFDLGAKLNVMAGDGVPTNDVVGYGLVGRWHFSDRFSLGLMVDHSPEFDVERTPELLGIVQDPSLEVIDSKATSTSIKLSLERRWGGERRIEWVLGVIVGIDSIDVEDVPGRDAFGNAFVIRTDAGTEPVAGVLGGARFKIGRRCLLEATLHAEQHFAGWKLEELSSGRRGEQGDYLLTGIQLGLAIRF
jgi:hypothetical protein